MPTGPAPMRPPVGRRIADRIVTLREGETATALMMFAYSFLAMTSYNILKPITRSQFIIALGADNLPYVQLAAGALIGVLMQGYGALAGRLPRRSVIPATQAAAVVLLTLFWFLFRVAGQWVSVAFYLLALILGILLTSQFWTLANDVYDARQAKRLFGFIGGGASLGGAMGAGLTSLAVKELGTNNLLLVSAAILGICALLVTAIVRRQPTTSDLSAAAADEAGVAAGEAIRLLRSSRHLQLIALVIGFAAIGAAIIEQQLNMAAASIKGASPDAITAFLSQITLYLSVVGFVVQVALTSRIHRSLGLAFALLILPVSLGTSAILILWSGALWAAGAARVLDTSLRYTIDKTTREVLFLPLPTALKYRAKPFVDVTVDRSAKAAGALLTLVLIKPWGLHLTWQHLSYASLVATVCWIVLALRARGEYLTSFRRGLDTRAMVPATVRLDVADAATIELLVQELASPDQSRVLYAIDMLETLDRRNLITPLLLRHESAAVRVHALAALESARPSITARWTPVVDQMLRDRDGEVRAAAVHAIAVVHKQTASPLMRRYLQDSEPRVVVAAALALANTGAEADASAAEAALARLVGDTREEGAAARKDVAAALARITDPRCRSLLVPLIHDGDLDVARTAIRSAHILGPVDFLFVPALVARLGHRLLKAAARGALVSYGDDVSDVLAFCMRDGNEARWVRRHIPGTLACIPTQRSMNVLIDALTDRDGFLRYKALAALGRLRREHPDLRFDRAPLQAHVLKETSHHYHYLTLRFNILRHDADAGGSLLGRALDDKLERGRGRLYALLGLMHPWQDVAAARYTMAHGDGRGRAAAIEYLDNVLDGTVRKRVMPILDETPMDDKVRQAHAFLDTRPRNLEDSLAQLVDDDDPTMAAAAIHFIARGRLWSLADHLERASTHGQGDDRFLSQAASWALAARAMPMTRSDEPDQPLPAVEVVDRLRSIPIFERVSVDELFRIASTGRQVSHRGGHQLYGEGTPVDEVLFLIDGRVTLASTEVGPQALEAPAALAFLEMLEGSPVRHTIRAVDRVTCMAFRAEQFLTMLSDNIALAEGFFRMEMDAAGASPGHPVTAASPGLEPIEPRAGALQPLEKVILLEQNPVLAHATVSQLIEVAGIAREMPLRSAAVLFTETDPPTVYYIVSGEVRLEREAAEPIDAGPGTTIGVPEMLAGVPIRWRATVTRDGLALQVARDDLFELLADDIELLQRFFGRFLRAHAVTSPS
jgi:AAA family ATP:ADP antiporter